MDSSPVEDENMIFYSTDSAQTFDYNECMECLEKCELNGLNATRFLGCCMKPAQIMKEDAPLWQHRKQEEK
jgi:hypothetical protein